MDNKARIRIAIIISHVSARGYLKRMHGEKQFLQHGSSQEVMVELELVLAS